MIAHTHPLDKLGELFFLCLRGTTHVALTTSSSSIFHKENKKPNLYKYLKGVIEYLLLIYSPYSTSYGDALYFIYQKCLIFIITVELLNHS